MADLAVDLVRRQMVSAPQPPARHLDRFHCLLGRIEVSDGSQEAVHLGKPLISSDGDRLTDDRTSVQMKARSRVDFRMLSEDGREQGTERMGRGQYENRFPQRNTDCGVNPGFGNRLHFPQRVNNITVSGPE